VLDVPLEEYSLPTVAIAPPGASDPLCLYVLQRRQHRCPSLADVHSGNCCGLPDAEDVPPPPVM